MIKMVRYGLVILLMCCTQNIATAQVDTARMIFEKLRTRLSVIKDYTADVSVKIDVTFMKVPPLSGKMYFKAPDKMKLERNGGISILPKKNMSMTLNSMLPVGDATVIDAGKDYINGRPVRIIKVIPTEDAGQIILTKIWVDYERNLALRTETTTRDNGTIKMDLTFAKYVKQGLPDKVIVHMDVKDYKLPKGVTMDYETEKQVKTQAVKGKGKKGKIEISYLNYEINKGLPDKIFVDNG